MSHGEVAMVLPRTAISAFLRSGIDRGRAPLIAGAVLTLGSAGIAAITFGPPHAVIPKKALETPLATALAGSSTELAAVHSPVEARPQPDSDELSRYRTRFLMNTGGQVRPFGGLSR